MPLAFVPDWKKSDYIDKRASLDYSEVDPNDLIPLPRSEDIKTDFNSIFTYLTMFLLVNTWTKKDKWASAHMTE